MKRINILLGLALIISLIKGEEPSAPFYSRMAVTDGNAKVNNEFTLTFSLGEYGVKSLENMGSNLYILH